MYGTVLLCLVTAIQGGGLLVSQDDLAALPDALLLDVRPRDQYERGHIPGAAQLDATVLSETRDGARGLLRPVEDLARLLGEAGVDPARHIVVYGDASTFANLSYVTRTFWVLEYLGYERVSLLDGGFTQWQQEDRPVESGPPQSPSIPNLALKPREELLATREDVTGLLESGQGILIDSRLPEFYSGAEKKDYVKRAGHIPGAVNLPSANHAEGPALRFEKNEQLEENFAKVGAKSDTPAIVYCDTGRSASVNYFVGRLLGHRFLRLYDGSFSEWAAQEQYPVALGAEPENRETQ